MDGLRSELDRFSPWVGSISCWAFCTKLEKFNMAQMSVMPSIELEIASRCRADEGVFGVECLAADSRRRGKPQDDAGRAAGSAASAVFAEVDAGSRSKGGQVLAARCVLDSPAAL